MFTRKFLNLIISIVTILSLGFMGSGQVVASSQQAGKNPPYLKHGKIKQADRQLAANAKLQQLSTSTMAMPSVNPGGTPDYFGLVPNFANSPLPVNEAAVSFTDAGLPPAVSATATAQVTNGVVTGLTITNGGSGYTSAPLVTISGVGAGATASASVSGVVAAIGVTNPGAGYINPTVSITGDGTGAKASAVVDTTVGSPTLGQIININVLNPGSGYTTTTVTISDVVGGGAGATASASLDVRVTGLTLLTGGNGYAYGGIRKFVDGLPGLCGLSAPNNLGQCLPVAIPDTTSYPGSDYYEIELVKYTQKLHTDLPPIQLEGYRQVNMGGTPTTYLGPIIVAQRGTPVRVKFHNNLPTGAAGNLFIPVDTTVMGAGDGPKGTPYSQNRATLHLHGGTTPWISDGTMHQWTTPAGELTDYPSGVSVNNVPDMDGGVEPAGTLTFYYTNQQSARLMFYHDHAYGITRLNVYAGQAAGYLVRDSVEQGLETSGAIPPLADNIPLIIQDKTFVPDDTKPFTNQVGTFPSQLAAQDPTWDSTKYGGFGQLWFPHVYMTNQNPYDVSGANAMGRWDYGPWFWPPFTGIANGEVPNPLYDCGPGGACSMPWEPPFMPGTPNPSIVPEAFMDTPLVNGVAYPTLKVDPKAYRFRILNAANDRYWNLSLFTADPTVTTLDGRSNTEVKMVRFNSSQNLLTPFPDWWYTSGNPFSLDDRAGGVPDPTTRGPAMIQIGTEGGFLPAPVVINNQPVNYNYNRRDIVVLNVQEKALFLGPAERADVVVDFSNFAGKTLILYSDAPAPVPASDPRVDYYTGDPDQTATGGAPSTLPGFGPNTRTLMQIVVSGVGGSAPVDDVNPVILSKLQAALPAAYAASQDKPLVPQAEYNTAFAATYPNNNFARIQDNSLSFFNGPLTGVQVFNGGSGYSTPPAVSITGGGGIGATATASLVGTPVLSLVVTNPGSKYKSIPIVTIAPPPAGGTQATALATISKGLITGLTLINGGSGYLATPSVTISGGGGSGAQASATIGIVNTGIKIALTNGGSGYTSKPTVGIIGGGGSGAVAVAVGLNMTLQPKSIIENFDMDYGRMNAMLGVEIPNTTGMNQTSIPYTDIDPPTEIFKSLPAGAAATPIGTGADGTQIWKITHNGVDTHAMHWHMFNVQVLNRVGWDGAIRPPDANELGWKETVRMNPLEDVIVAMRPIRPNIPWDLPNSIRLLDVTMPPGSPIGFQNMDPTGHPATVTNQIVNFGWEYVWHCHLLGHEENIMMRPIIFAVEPNTPANLVGVYKLVNKKKVVDLTWTDQSLNETSFTVQRATNANGPWTTLGTVNGVNGSGGPVTYRNNNVTTGTYFYQVIATNLVGFTQTYAAPAVGYPTQAMNSAPVTSTGVIVP
ncbi:MAG TPA: hypothetical protein VGK00_13460 [Anaerolineales bacterium]|jgi:FtsP/CotA-like multicopper oxidase with cupredoxin domain